MTRIINIIILVILLPFSTMAQHWLQSEKRTAQNPQIHKEVILSQLPNDNIIRNALNTPYVDTDYKVYDMSNTFSDRQLSKIESVAKDILKRSNIDIAIAFISEPNWTDNDNENYCMNFYDYNDFGVGDKYDGLCMVVNMATHRYAIFDCGEPQDLSVAGNNLGKYQELIAPYFRRDQYAEGIIEFLNQYEKDYIYELNTPWWQRPFFLLCLLGGIILSLIVTSMRATRKCKIQKAITATNYERPNSFRVTINRDTFISTHTTKAYDPPHKSSGGGHRSGSSGISHSGGSGGW